MKTLPLRREPWCNDERAIDNDKKLLAGATYGARGAAVVSNLARRRWPGVSGARARAFVRRTVGSRSEEHTSELQSLMRISYAVFCLKKKKEDNIQEITHRKDSN